MANEAQHTPMPRPFPVARVCEGCQEAKGTTCYDWCLKPRFGGGTAFTGGAPADRPTGRIIGTVHPWHACPQCGALPVNATSSGTSGGDT
jgi:hypothetical protein